MALVSRHLSRILKFASAGCAAVALCGLAQAQIVYLQATINASQEVPPTSSTATGLGCFSFDPSTNMITYNITFSGLVGTETAAHFHLGALGVNGGVIVVLPSGSPKTGTASLTASQVTALLAGNIYTNIHSTVFPNGEIRGQLNVIPAITTICIGDGTGGTCPCSNQSLPGNNEGCLHSGGVGGKLVASGGTSITCDTLSLSASQMLGANSIFIQGSNVPVGPFAFGDGLRCIGGTLRRLGVVPVSGGNASLGTSGTTPIHTLGQVIPGSYGYQVYFRDPQSFCTSLTYNITNGVQVTWVP
jgi:CHRD domain